MDVLARNVQRATDWTMPPRASGLPYGDPDARPRGRLRLLLLPIVEPYGLEPSSFPFQEPNQMLIRSTKRWIAVAATFVIAGVFAAACSSGTNGGSSSNNNNDGCTFGGTKCAAGCSETLGCIECSADSMCGAGSPFCVLGRCEECNVSADCGTGKTCYPRDHKCGAACTANGDCPGDSPICEPMTGICVGCSTNADCKDAKKPLCDPTRRQCSECITSNDCGAAQPACDQQNGDCRECLVDGHCPAGSLCGTDAKCHSACTSNLDCKDAGKPVCDLGSKSCVECLTNMECGAARPVCDGKNCQVCLTHADCTNPATPVCKDKNSCVGCLSNTDCKDVLLPICKGESCIQCDKDEHCPMDKPKCDNQVCVP